jgi:hypothetical protein
MAPNKKAAGFAPAASVLHRTSIMATLRPGRSDSADPIIKAEKAIKTPTHRTFAPFHMLLFTIKKKTGKCQEN